MPPDCTLLKGQLCYKNVTSMKNLKRKNPEWHLGVKGSFCPSMYPRASPLLKTPSLKTPDFTPAKTRKQKVRFAGREQASPLFKAPGTPRLQSGCVPASALLSGGAWNSPRVVLSSAKVPNVPRIPFPGQAHRGGTSQVPTGDQWSQLL